LEDRTSSMQLPIWLVFLGPRGSCSDGPVWIVSHPASLSAVAGEASEGGFEGEGEALGGNSSGGGSQRRGWVSV